MARRGCEGGRRAVMEAGLVRSAVVEVTREACWDAEAGV